MAISWGRFRLDARKKLFTVRVLRHWSRFSREVVSVPSLEVFKAPMDEAMNNLARSRGLGPRRSSRSF